MTFADNLNRICKEKGTTVTATLKRMGVSTAKTTMWNNGSLPKQEMLVRLAKELDCTVMDFFADEEDLIDVTQETADLKVLVEGYKQLPKSAQHRLLAYYYALTEGKE